MSLGQMAIQVQGTSENSRIEKVVEMVKIKSQSIHNLSGYSYKGKEEEKATGEEVPIKACRGRRQNRTVWYHTEDKGEVSGQYEFQGNIIPKKDQGRRPKIRPLDMHELVHQKLFRGLIISAIEVELDSKDLLKK